MPGRVSLRMLALVVAIVCVGAGASVGVRAVVAGRNARRVATRTNVDERGEKGAGRRESEEPEGEADGGPVMKIPDTGADRRAATLFLRAVERAREIAR